MKSGICPKCERSEVYVDTPWIANSHGIGVTLAFPPIATDLLVCVNCGYLEFYLAKDSDAEKISNKFKKVDGGELHKNVTGS